LPGNEPLADDHALLRSPDCRDGLESLIGARFPSQWPFCQAGSSKSKPRNDRGSSRRVPLLPQVRDRRFRELRLLGNLLLRTCKGKVKEKEEVKRPRGSLGLSPNQGETPAPAASQHGSTSAGGTQGVALG
jgi:hypothetical protein